MPERLDGMRADPRAGWTIADVEAVCAGFGIACHAPRGGGSHDRIGCPSQRGLRTRVDVSRPSVEGADVADAKPVIPGRRRRARNPGPQVSIQIARPVVLDSGLRSAAPE